MLGRRGAESLARRTFFCSKIGFVSSKEKERKFALFEVWGRARKVVTFGDNPCVSPFRL